MAARVIRVGNLARVEGEGGLKIRVRDGRVERAELSIFEPPRFFEALLRGRGFAEAPDITARICGICPVAYQMSAVQAMEDALGITVPAPLRDLRRLLYCGEWIESHTLHIYLLHAPDFLGYAGGIEMARDHAETVQRGLALKKAGNRVVALLGGREIHPINVRVGGFYRVPSRAELRALEEPLEQALEDALATVRWVGSFDFPALERDYAFVALRDAEVYPFAEGRIALAGGPDVPAAAFLDHVEEMHLPHSTALHGTLHGRPHFVGPLARYALNAAHLPDCASAAAAEAGLGPVCRNPYQSIVVRAVEVVFACAEAIRLIRAYEPPEIPAMPVRPRAGVGHGATEAPRGLLYHRYRLGDDGTIEDAVIVPPTSQNQATIEEDLRAFVGDWLDLEDEALRWRCEQAVRNYDPCISCATHFLRLEIDRG